MTEALAKILKAAEQPSAPERAELADRLVESLANNIPPEIAHAHVAEVRRRVAEVEAGEVSLVPGEEVLASVRGLLASAGAGD
jgi:putative addiction module component (TIGR02574 family)